MAQRIRYESNNDGTTLTSPIFLAGKTYVEVRLNLKTNTFTIHNTDNNSRIGEAVVFRTKAEGMKKAKTVLKTLGVIFQEEKRNTAEDHAIFTVINNKVSGTTTL